MTRPGLTRPMLFLVIDAIPYEMAAALWMQGAMRDFGRPRPLVSVFPSLTHVALPGLVRPVFDEVPPGYEARYYHPPSGEILGGFTDPEAERAVAHFQVRPQGNIGHLAVYGLSRALAFGAVRWIRHRFLNEGGPWLGYLGATDGVMHFYGADALRDTVRDIFEQVDQLRHEFEQLEGVRPGAVICSDHGAWFGSLTHTDVSVAEQLLRIAGFLPGDRGRDGVVLAPFGDVGGGVVYCDRSRAPEVAQVMAEAPGVDVAFGVIEDGCEILAAHGMLERARLRWQGDRYHYEARSGDPLQLAPVWEELGGGWLDERTLLQHTWNHPYPFAPPRIRRGLTDLVQWPAQVLFSMADDHTFGPPYTDIAARLRGGQIGTHGGLSRTQSLGFAMTTEPWDEGPVRAEDVFLDWRELVGAGGAPLEPA